MTLCLQDLKSKADLDKFVESQPENVLTVVNVSSNATPCVRVFPAVLALAKNFVGYAAFARLLYETSQETQSLANQLRVLEVRTPPERNHRDVKCLTMAASYYSCLTYSVMYSLMRLYLAVGQSSL